jgi:hypothetical protein
MKMAAFWVVAMIALMMEAIQTSETLANSYQSRRRYNPEGSHLRVSGVQHLQSQHISFAMSDSKYTFQ